MSESLYLDYGPGLEFVDLLGLDFYMNNLTDPWFAGLIDELAMVVDLAERTGKIAAWTEGGAIRGLSDYENDPACDFWTQKHLGPILDDVVASGISYYLMWYNRPEGPKWGPAIGHCTEADFKKICDRPDTALEGELNLYSLP